MKYYLITDFDVDIRVNDLECQLAAEHLGWQKSETYKAAEEQVRKAEEVLDELRFLSPTKDEERVLNKLERVLREEHDIDTDLIVIEEGYHGSFCYEELKLDGKDILPIQNQCDECGAWVDGEIHIKDYFAGKRPTCPKCGKTYTPCNECMWDENCSVCPFKKD